MRAIITCGCANTTDYAKDAFKILFPNDKIDKVIEKPDDDLLDSINNYLALYSGKEIDFSKPYALLYDTGKYNDDQMPSIYNLMKGYKIC